MRMRQLIFAVIMLTGGLAGGAPRAEAAVCQNKTVIVYSNGMFNERYEADFSLKKLRHRLNAYPQAASLLPFEYTLAYARDNNLYTDPITGVVTDGGWGQWYEVTRQIRADRASVFWRWAAADPAAPQAFRDEQLRIAAQINLQAYTNDADLTGHLDGIYRPALTQGKRILIVAHSQGNLYANAAYDRLLLDGTVGPTKNHVGIVAVASPASFVNGNNGNAPHVTAFEDLIILGVGQNYSLNPLPGTHSNFGDIATNDASGHNFVKYYLAGSQTRVAILNHIVTMISGVNGVGGLQYPTQGCTAPVAGPAIPQPGPYYYRDDWTVHLGSRAVNGWSTSYILKHLRDDSKGIAYSIDVQHEVSPVVQEAVTINVYDYTTNQSQGLYVPNFTPTIATYGTGVDVLFTGADDVVVWNDGLLFLYYLPGDVFTADSIVWIKLTILDNGAGASPRWVVGAREEGKFVFPSYQYIGLVKVKVANPLLIWEYQSISSNRWGRKSGSYRIGNYNYKIVQLSGNVSRLNAPAGVFRSGAPELRAGGTAENLEAYYSTMNIDNGIISFGPIGAVIINVNMQSNVQNSFPSIDLGLGQSLAYNRMQSYFTVNAISNAKVYWNGGVYATTNGVLDQALGWGSIAASLSPAISLLTDVNGTHKLGANGTVFANDPSLQQLNPPITIPPISTFTNPIYLTPEQKVFLEAP